MYQDYLDITQERHLDTLDNIIMMLKGRQFHYFCLQWQTESLNLPNGPWLEKRRASVQTPLTFILH